MTLVAVTEIRHGEADGSVKTFGIGDTVEGLSEEQERSLVLTGAVIETGERKYTSAPTVAAVSDAETRKRDELLAKAAMGEDVVSPAVATATGSPDANADGDKTIGQAAAEASTDENTTTAEGTTRTRR